MIEFLLDPNVILHARRSPATRKRHVRVVRDREAAPVAIERRLVDEYLAVGAVALRVLQSDALLQSDHVGADYVYAAVVADAENADGAIVAGGGANDTAALYGKTYTVLVRIKHKERERKAP